MKKKLAFAVVVLLCLSLMSGLFGGCSGNVLSVFQKSISVNLTNEPYNLNPLTATDPEALNIIRQVNEGLVIYDQDGKLAPGLCESWTADPDGVTYTFTLRKNLRWSNGDPLTASDFVYGVQCLLNPACDSAYNYLGYIVKSGQDYEKGKIASTELGITAPDDMTVVITFDKADDNNLSALTLPAFFPINKDFFDAEGADYGQELSKLIFSGPYAISSWVQDSEIDLAQNSDYRGGRNVSIDKIKYQLFSENEAAAAAFNNKQLDLLNLTSMPTDLYTSIAQTPASFYDGTVYYLQFNFGNSLTANPDIRKALSLSVDREALVSTALQNRYSPAATIIPPSVFSSSDMVASPSGSSVSSVSPVSTTADLVTAAAALKSGLAKLGLGTLTIPLLTDDSTQAKALAQFLSDSWGKIGIVTEITSLPFNSRLQAMSRGEYAVAMAGYTPPTPNAASYLMSWETGGIYNLSKYSNHEADALIAAIKANDGSVPLDQAIGQLQTIYLNDLTVAPLYFGVTSYVISDKLTGVTGETFRGIDLSYAKVK